MGALGVINFHKAPGFFEVGSKSSEANKTEHLPKIQWSGILIVTDICCVCKEPEKLRMQSNRQF